MTDFNKEADLLILYLDYCNEIRFWNARLKIELRSGVPLYWDKYTHSYAEPLSFGKWDFTRAVFKELTMDEAPGRLEKSKSNPEMDINKMAISYLMFTPPYRKEFVPEVYVKPKKNTFICDAVTVDISKINNAYGKFNQRKRPPSIEDICGKLINWDKRKKLKLVPFEGVDHIILVPQNNANKKGIDRLALGMDNLRKEINLEMGFHEDYMKDDFGNTDDLDIFNSYLYRDRLELAKEQLITYAVSSKELSANDFDIIHRFVNLLLKTKSLWKKIKSLVS